MAETLATTRRWLRFSLRALLLLMLVVGATIGWTLHKVREQGAALAALLNGRCAIAYRDGADPESPNALERCRRWLGEEHWIDVEVLILVHPEADDAVLAHVRGLPRLRYLILDGSAVSDAGLVNLRFLPMLAELHLDHTRVTDAGLANLRFVPMLTELNLANTQVTDAGLVHLRGCSQLQGLDLSGTHGH